MCNKEVMAHRQSCRVRTIIVWRAASVIHRVQGLYQQSVASFCWGHFGRHGALTFSPLTMPTAVVHYCSSWGKSRLSLMSSEQVVCHDRSHGGSDDDVDRQRTCLLLLLWLDICIVVVIARPVYLATCLWHYSTVKKWREVWSFCSGWCIDTCRAVPYVILICFSTLILFVFIVLEVIGGKKKKYLQVMFLSNPLRHIFIHTGIDWHWIAVQLVVIVTPGNVGI
jgi:hypothetical protein